jgi:hypothetical protein
MNEEQQDSQRKRHLVENMNEKQINLQRQRDRVENMNEEQKETQRLRKLEGNATTPMRFDVPKTRTKKAQSDELEDIEEGSNDDGNAVVRRHVAKNAHERPSPAVFSRFEHDPYASILLCEEMTGFAECDKQRIHDNMIHPDKNLRKEAEKDFAHFGKTFGPEPHDLNRIWKEFYDEGGHHHTHLQSCGVCGRKDFNDKLNCHLYPIDKDFMETPLRLNPAEVMKYNTSPSRVYGLLHLSVLEMVAIKNKSSLSSAYEYLYNREGATDEEFAKVVQEYVDKHDGVDDGGGVDVHGDEKIFYIYAELVSLPSTNHIEESSENNMPLLSICKECKESIDDKTRPPFSMGGLMCANFGFPKFIDGLAKDFENLTIAEILALAKVRPYVHMIKAVKDKSKDPYKCMTGNNIKFSH